jgi:hypothetical protein
MEDDKGGLHDTPGCDECQPSEISDSAIFKMRPEVCIRESTEEDGKHLVYQMSTDTALFMNRTGKRVLELCDGVRTLKEIINTIADEYEVPESVTLGTVMREYVSALSRMQLVAPS